MTRLRPKPIVWAILLVALVAVSGASAFGYHVLLQNRTQGALDAAGRYYTSIHAGDPDEFVELMPPALVDAVGLEAVEQLASAQQGDWEPDGSASGETELTLYFTMQPMVEGDLGGSAEFELSLASDPSLDSAVVKVEAIFASGPNATVFEQTSNVELAWQKGAWRVIRVKSKAAGATERLTYWSEDGDLKRLYEDLASRLGGAVLKQDELPPGHPDPVEMNAPPLTPDKLQEGLLPDGHPPLSTTP